jgi:hypothetical protein
MVIESKISKVPCMPGGRKLCNMALKAFLSPLIGDFQPILHAKHIVLYAILHAKNYCMYWIHVLHVVSAENLDFDYRFSDHYMLNI